MTTQHLLFLWGLLTAEDLKQFGWAFAIFSGFGVKIAIELSDKINRRQRITVNYFLSIMLSGFVTFVVGYYAKPIIEGHFDNKQVQAGVLALVGAVGFEATKAFYRFASDQRMWNGLLTVFFRRWLTPRNNNSNNVSDEPDQF